ncbi:hypothetical protein GCM10009733_021290 [Nonomuraea maheshkhaliensis]|uniref:Uncharacterized protein n=1 Tax=Nonomuraea maheshkhaliensis TaxID=419590 RepID=A0ABN2EZW5_9ACTN
MASHVTIDGRDVPVRDTSWVVWGPDGQPYGIWDNDPRIADDPAKAARSFWPEPGQALRKLNEGWHLELMTGEQCRTQVLPIYRTALKSSVMRMKENKA